MRRIILAFSVILFLSSLSITASANKHIIKHGVRVQHSTLAYPNFLKRNPFQTFLYTKKPSVSFKVGEVPLFQYSLSSLKIVGIMEREGTYFAMIQTPDNKSYIITVDSIIGVNRARVVSINDNSINLIENTYNALGQAHTIKVVMKIVG